MHSRTSLASINNKTQVRQDTRLCRVREPLGDSCRFVGVIGAPPLRARALGGSLGGAWRAPSVQVAVTDRDCIGLHWMHESRCPGVLWGTAPPDLKDPPADNGQRYRSYRYPPVAWRLFALPRTQHILSARPLHTRHCADPLEAFCPRTQHILSTPPLRCSLCSSPSVHSLNPAGTLPSHPPRRLATALHALAHCAALPFTETATLSP